ncbi:hypothetical protein B0H12DRAFT_1077394 [Mycena haematopus]|nr:hypothetical protein B0H12DRAFT_1077394 [Mycena haematopus]
MSQRDKLSWSQLLWRAPDRNAEAYRMPPQSTSRNWRRKRDDDNAMPNTASLWFHPARFSSSDFGRTPGVLEKQRRKMAERRASVKARRRQWDTPKQARHIPPLLPALSRSPDALSDPEDLDGELVTSAERLRSAEQFALGVLADMAAARCASEPVSGPAPPCDPIVNYPDGASDFSSRSSLPFSVEAVIDAPMGFVKLTTEYTADPLPPCLSPLTPLQKKIRRELGQVPLNAIQQLQWAANDLALPMTESEWEIADGEIVDEDVLEGSRSPGQPTISETRIRLWRRHPEYETTWDRVTRQRFASAALAQR